MAPPTPATNVATPRRRATRSGGRRTQKAAWKARQVELGSLLHERHGDEAEAAPEQQRPGGDEPPAWVAPAGGGMDRVPAEGEDDQQGAQTNGEAAPPLYFL